MVCTVIQGVYRLRSFVRVVGEFIFYNDYSVAVDIFGLKAVGYLYIKPAYLSFVFGKSLGNPVI